MQQFPDDATELNLVITKKWTRAVENCTQKVAQVGTAGHRKGVAIPHAVTGASGTSIGQLRAAKINS